MPQEPTPIWPRRQLIERGWTDQTLRRAKATGELVQVRRGCYAPPPIGLDDRAQHLQLVRATLPGLHPDAVVSHASAAALHGLPLQAGWLGRVRVTRTDGGHGRRRGPVHLVNAPLDAEEVVELDGVRVTSLARTAADLARELPFEWGVITCDAALAAGLSRAELMDAVARGRRRTGSPRARCCAEFADGRSESPAESLSRVQFDRMGIPAPELQYEIRHLGSFIARCDFAWPAQRLVGECDGRGKYGALLASGDTPEDAIMREKRREEQIRQAGWWVVRWGWAEARDGYRLATLVRGALEQGRRSA
nr:type IV toxin-antitoxin system AbiEi family antitoxin domain-containing protein [Propionibacterium sp.]